MSVSGPFDRNSLRVLLLGRAAQPQTTPPEPVRATWTRNSTRAEASGSRSATDVSFQGTLGELYTTSQDFQAEEEGANHAELAYEIDRV